MSIFTKITSITNDQLIEKMRGDKGIQIIDVRVKERYEKGHIPGAPNVPWKQIKAGNYHPDGKVYIICHSGVDSRKSAKKLTAMGYDVVNVSGGMVSWDGPITKY
ncbi:rhodanese-like domain-containing protein [Companilactobacillus zhongbaensis]|uniref:rhodanese-like domain-containing protein n=1 Tax=Companilactobacillus zhongbaensis TaxID=2486009 RepID=UPI000F76F1B4|nr:rhodanese-like domain-containing protein [Companilactobacillus zhongbaensis]